MTDSSALARLRELARHEALNWHLKAKGHGDDFDTCPNPDCVLVRAEPPTALIDDGSFGHVGWFNPESDAALEAARMLDKRADPPVEGWRPIATDDEKRILRALGNCYMMAKREQARIINLGMRDTHAITLERWQHVLRFCEEAGCTSSILRAQVPDEITGG